MAVATFNGPKNTVPWFVTAKGPVREARFKRSANGTADGEVHNLFVITGRADAVGCNIAQPDFLPAGDPITAKGGDSYIIFRISSSVIWAGVIVSHSESYILSDL